MLLHYAIVKYCEGFVAGLVRANENVGFLMASALSCHRARLEKGVWHVFFFPTTYTVHFKMHLILLQSSGNVCLFLYLALCGSLGGAQWLSTALNVTPKSQT